MSATLNMNAKENNTATTKMDYLDALCILGTSKWINKIKNNSLKSDVERSGITIDPVEYVQTLYQDAKVIAEFIRKYGANLTPDDEWISILCDFTLTQCYSDEEVDEHDLTPLEELCYGYIAHFFYYSDHHLSIWDNLFTPNEIRAVEIALEILARNGESADNLDVEDWLELEHKIGHKIDNEEFKFLCDHGGDPDGLEEDDARELDDIFHGRKSQPMTVAQLIAVTDPKTLLINLNSDAIVNRDLDVDWARNFFIKKIRSVCNGNIGFIPY